jgi:hypothetical protein
MAGSFLALGVGTDTGAGWDAVREDARQVMASLAPWTTDATYLPMADETVDEKRGWTDATWERLTAIRNAADPHGLFVPPHVPSRRS